MKRWIPRGACTLLTAIAFGGWVASGQGAPPAAPGLAPSASRGGGEPGVQSAGELPVQQGSYCRRTCEVQQIAARPARPPSVTFGAPALAIGSPEQAIFLMLEAFANRSVTGYVQAMAEDFVFTSDDPDHIARYPNGMTRDDEERFARKLFVGGWRGPDDAPLPIATGVELTAGPILALAAEAGETRRVIHVLASRITLDDGTVMDVGGTLNTMDLVLTEAGWRVRRWHESIFPPDSKDLAQAATAGEYTTLPRHP